MSRVVREEAIRKFKEMVHEKAAEARARQTSRRHHGNFFSREPRVESQEEICLVLPAKTCRAFVLKDTARNYGKNNAKSNTKKKQTNDEQVSDQFRLYVILDRLNLHDEYFESLIEYGVDKINDILLLVEGDFTQVGICKSKRELLRLAAMLEELDIFDEQFDNLFDYGVERISDLLLLNCRDYSILEIQRYSLGKIKLCAFLDRHDLFTEYFTPLDDFGVDYIKDIPELTNKDFDFLQISISHRRQLVAAATDFFDPKM